MAEDRAGKGVEEWPTCVVCNVRAPDCAAFAARGADLIQAERRRQIQQEGWTPEHDDEHNDFELTKAAICYLQAVAGLPGAGSVDDLPGEAPPGWPWHPDWWKPSLMVRDLVKAGALIAAEIDRLQRRPTLDGCPWCYEADTECGRPDCTADWKSGRIAPAAITAEDGHAEVKLSFGPVAWIIPTADNAGFDVTIWRQSVSPFSQPVAHMTVTFGPDLKPHLEFLEVRDA